MKKFPILFAMVLPLLITSFFGCQKGNSQKTSSESSSASIQSSSMEEDPDGYVDVLPENNDGTILQAFNWKFTDIKDNLSAISNSGFKVVQTSPVQQPKNGGPNWYSFYQPVSFSIGDNSSLGTKEELRELCEEAEKYGIAIICDIVFNHLANIGDEYLEADGTPMVSPEVEKYEPYIYEHRNDKSNATFHHNKKASGSGAITQYYQYGALPDLNTGNEYVQQRSLDLLKECIDVGVDGFRFDAAKHIETPYDPQYASNFWPNVLGVAKTYYQEKTGKELIAYGEILNGPDGGRTVENYTEFMKITDNSFISNIASASVGGNAQKAVDARYGSSDPSKLITWVESHDTYVGSKSTHISDTKFARQYAIIASRKDSVPLFLARPHEKPNKVSADTPVEVGVVRNYTFENEEVGIANRFHNRFIGCDEDQHAQESIYINERYDGNQAGAILVGLKGETHTEVTFNHLGTGVYYDQKTGDKVEVRNNVANVDIDATGVLVLTKSRHFPHPSIEISQRNTSFADSLEITLKAIEAPHSYYTINGGTPVEFTNTKKITIGDVVDENNMVYLDIVLENAEFSVERHLKYRRVTLIDGYFNICNLKPSYLTDYELYYWAWGGGSNGTWLNDYEVQDGNVLIDFTGKPYTGFLLAIFEKDYVIPNKNAWDSSLVKQTGDIDPNGSFYDAYNF